MQPMTRPEWAEGGGPTGTGDGAPNGQHATEPAPPEGLIELARQSLADGTPLGDFARWFDVSEDELRRWMDAATAPVVPEEDVHQDPVAGAVDEVAPEPEPQPEASTPAPEPVPAEPVPAEPAVAVRPSPATRRIVAADPPRRAAVPEPRPSRPSSMNLRDAIQVLRRRVLIVVALMVVGASAGWVSAPGTTPGRTTYAATHTLIYEPNGSQTYNIEQLALLAGTGAVPTRVAARLKLDRGQVRSAVAAVANQDVGTITITARSSTADGAVSLADVTAEELVVEAIAGAQGAYNAEIGRLTAEIDSAQARLNAVPAKDATGQAAARADLSTAQQALQQYQKSTPAPKPQLRTLETATATAVRPAGVKAPNSKTGRALLLGGFGLLIGIAGALATDRLDSRIRSKARAEEAFGAPVVAEVPPIPKASQGKLVTGGLASSPFTEAYRGLRTYVALWAPDAEGDDGHRVILVTSPGAAEGKTTTVAHLAAMLAELGRSVIVISADLRRPQLHHYFDLPASPGLVEALAPGADRPVFSGLDRATGLRGVRLIPSGAPVENPAPLFEHAGALIAATRRLADFVLIDAPPILVANDAVEMARHADGVLLVARAGKTPVEAAMSSAEILDRLEIPVVGTVLVASEAASSAHRYYGARYYAEPEPRARRLRRRPAGDPGRPEA